MEMDDATLERYARQVLVEEIGYDGQCAILQTPLRVTAPDGVWRDLVCRYLSAAGFPITVADGVDPALVVSGEKYRQEIPLGSDIGRLMMAVGQAITRVILSTASEK
ncbi:MAG: hypothetical protein C7B46_13500 [Sulfobacillus benefaciens]|uniref:Uncharacterized protein n=1 Tax=Sulfobacillus benefaciens TaxID=453960 RepID=A0A2T2XDQ5_9FIRM|nr:MAG: hypothetical protein C7B46_13500 [Sulfobacillus benefaciens]